MFWARRTWLAKKIFNILRQEYSIFVTLLEKQSVRGIVHSAGYYFSKKKLQENGFPKKRPEIIISTF